MNFKFYLKESEIYDFIGFPQMIYYTKLKEKHKDSNYLGILSDEFIALGKKIEGLLLPYEEEIELFYTEELFFAELAVNLDSIFKCKDKEEYLDMLSSLGEEDIIKNIIRSIMMGFENASYSEEIEERIEDFIIDREKSLKLIKDLPIDSGEKWNLFLFMEEPTRYMNKYIDLMKKLLYLFDDIYLEYKERVRECGENLVEILNEKGAKGLEYMSNSMINANLVENHEGRILISIVSPYSVRIVSTSKIPYIVWGLEMESAFKKIKEINENKLNERIQVFKNLSDKTRYEVLKLIAAKEFSTKGIAKALGVSSATISYHINNLVTASIIKIDKSDNKYGYLIDYEFLEEVLKDFKEDIMFPKEV